MKIKKYWKLHPSGWRASQEGLNIFDLQKAISDIASSENIDLKDISIESYVDEFHCGSPYSELKACFNKTVNTSKKEQLDYIKKRVNISGGWKIIYNEMKNTEFKRTGFNTSLLKEFDDTTIYDMIKENNIDRLVKYYSLYFSA